MLAAGGGEPARAHPAAAQPDAAVGEPARSAVAGQGGRSAAGQAGRDTAGSQVVLPASGGMNAPPSDADAGPVPAADSGVATSEDSSCLDGDVPLDGAGKFSYEAMSAQMWKLWVPKLPAGCKTPVVHFANGTGALCSNYAPVLERLASHGFLAVCAENTLTGTGVPGMRALEAALELFPDLAAHKLGSAGHEAGGQGAILTLQQAEAKWGARALYAGLAIAPASGHGSQPPSGTWQDAYASIISPMLVMSGSQDALVSESWVGNAFDALNDAIEAYWYSGVDVKALPLPQAHMQELSVAWFRWKLLGDRAACRYFKQLPQTERWDERKNQHETGCN